MNSATLATLMKARNLTPSQISEKVGVSRQALSKWLNGQKHVQIRSDHLQKLAELFHVSMETFMNPLPALENTHARELEATLNWDRLYPSALEMLLAVKKWEPQAVARLVQTYGLVTSARIVGDRSALWDRYPYYKKYIHPGIRKVLDQVWEQQWNQTSN
ncbi:MAG: helix-turn-helix transcriptional regulator [Bdellovibrio sp.]|nr:helix-turn-helix transcriptional regulator [Bdellovibrio sp.]